MENNEKILTLLEKHDVILNKILDKIDGMQGTINGMQETISAILGTQDEMQSTISVMQKDIAELKINQAVIIEHQNVDYELLQKVNKKVTNLADVSALHEQKFQKLKAL